MSDKALLSILSFFIYTRPITIESVNKRTNPGFRYFYNYELYFAVAAEFGVDPLFICKALSKYVKELRNHIEEFKAAVADPIAVEGEKKKIYLDLYQPILEANCPQ